MISREWLVDSDAKKNWVKLWVTVLNGPVVSGSTSIRGWTGTSPVHPFGSLATYGHRWGAPTAGPSLCAPVLRRVCLFAVGYAALAPRVKPQSLAPTPTAKTGEVVVFMQLRTGSIVAKGQIAKDTENLWAIANLTGVVSTDRNSRDPLRNIATGISGPGVTSRSPSAGVATNCECGSRGSSGRRLARSEIPPRSSGRGRGRCTLCPVRCPRRTRNGRCRRPRL